MSDQTEQTEQEKYLFIHRSWNWQWPDQCGRWPTKSTRRGPSEPYHGPSKGVVARRATRRAKRRTH